MQKYPTHLRLIRIIFKDAHKENEGTLKSIIIWIVRIVEKQSLKIIV